MDPRFRRRGPWGIALVVCAVALACNPAAPPLPVYGDVPPFALIDHRGEAVTRADFLGAPWVASFVFTRCALVCPRMAERMRILVRAHDGTPARFVSISVDPDHDTPEVLRAYAERLRAGARWWFLTGDRDAIGQLSIEGFKLGFEAASDPDIPVGERVVHSDRLVLVDAEGQIRGYYDAFDGEALETIQRDLASLLP